MMALFCKDLWWPFGAHLLHWKYRKLTAMKRGLELFYVDNNFPVFQDGQITHYFDVPLRAHEQKLEFRNVLMTLDEKLSFTGEFESIEQLHQFALRSIYKPNVFVQKYLEKNEILRVLKLTQYIVVHIRLGDKVAGPNRETEKIPIDDYLQVCDRMRKISGINNLCVCCETTFALEQVRELNAKYGFTLFYNQEEPRCPDDWRQSLTVRAQGNQITKQELETEYLTCFVNMELLLHATAIVADFDSCFALVAAEMRNCPNDFNMKQRTPLWGIHTDFCTIGGRGGPY